MATGGKVGSAIDTSTLLNFLRIGRVDLLAAHPAYRFVVVAQVEAEVAQKGQGATLEAAFRAGQLIRDDPPETTDIRELSIFAALPPMPVLGDGERAAIAAASARGLALAMDDKNAWKVAGAICAMRIPMGTRNIMVDLIVAGVIDVPQADAIKDDWKANHKFNLKGLSSFADLVS